MIRKFSTVYAGHVDRALDQRLPGGRGAGGPQLQARRGTEPGDPFFHLAETRERAVREITPWCEEHVKMFGPLGFVPGITPAQLQASTKRGGWDAAGVPTVEHYTEIGAWFAGPPEELVAY